MSDHPRVLLAFDHNDEDAMRVAITSMIEPLASLPADAWDVQRPQPDILNLTARTGERRMKLEFQRFDPSDTADFTLRTIHREEPGERFLSERALETALLDLRIPDRSGAAAGVAGLADRIVMLGHAELDAIGFPRMSADPGESAFKRILTVILTAVSGTFPAGDITHLLTRTLSGWQIQTMTARSTEALPRTDLSSHIDFEVPLILAASRWLTLNSLRILRPEHAVVPTESNPFDRLAAISAMRTLVDLTKPKDAR